MGSRGDLVRALLDGIDAGRAASPLISCPYPSGDLRRSAWLRGYARARELPAVDETAGE
ncbi:Rmf/CrpP fold protein [Streptomyces finlayi]|uniref:Rmf/CrpP fold protein n=1 Tax=Streptomyces finlayi TaxID=67296 RepID=UPI00167476DF|nr:Rmf/CrpP fold protein [Streptomyces finlayi]